MIFIILLYEEEFINPQYIIARPVEKVKNGYVYIIRGRNKRIGICFMKESPLWGCAFRAQAGNSPL